MMLTGPTPSLLQAALPVPVRRVEAVVRAGHAAGTWYVETSNGRMVAKRMELDRDPHAFGSIIKRVAALPGRPCPRLLATSPGDRCWYALFEYVDGDVGQGSWDAALRVLAELAALRCTGSSVELVWPWLRRLQAFGFPGSEERELLRRLSGSPPDGERVITHGDFSIQNFCNTTRGLVLLDWEFAGSAPAGFDAGWLTAQNRVGAGPGWPRRTLLDAVLTCGFDIDCVLWYEKLGLLRLLYRSLTLPIPDSVRALLAWQLRTVIAECLAED